MAVQTLLAREMANPPREPRLLRHLIQTSLRIGGTVALGLSLLTFWRRDAILRGLTTNVQIRAAAMQIFPVVLLTQVLKGLVSFVVPHLLTVR